MGNHYSSKIYYPVELTKTSNSGLRIANISNTNNKFILSLPSCHYEIIILICPYDSELYNYNEECIRLSSKNYIVIVMKPLYDSNDIVSHYLSIKADNVRKFINNISGSIKGNFCVLYSLNLIIDSISFIGHKLSCDMMADIIIRCKFKSSHKIFFIDPLFNNKLTDRITYCITKKEERKYSPELIHILLSKNYKSKFSKYIKFETLSFLTSHIYEMNDIPSDGVTNTLNCNPTEINQKNNIWNKIVSIIIDINTRY